jgi:hypothetical protein
MRLALVGGQSGNLAAPGGISLRMMSLRVALLATLAVATACTAAPHPPRSPASPSAIPPAGARGSPTAAATALTTPAPVTCADIPTSTATQIPDPLARPAVSAILGLFDEAPIVAVGEVHGWQAEHDVFAQLVCDPRFPEAVDAIVVEFGNSRLQPVLDRYILDGEVVSRAELQSVWRESSQRSGVWDHPAYERFFSLVRSVNQGLPRPERVRVLAGDPPIDFASVKKFSDCSDEDPSCLDYWIFRRNETFAQVVVDEVLARDGTALLIAGVGHMQASEGPPYPPSIPELVDAASPDATRVVIPHQGLGDADAEPERTIRAWPVPSVAMLGRSWLGALDACLLEGPDAAPDAPPCPDGSGPTLADVADAYLYLGPP